MKITQYQWWKGRHVFGAPCRESYQQGKSWIGHQRALNLAYAFQLLSIPPQMSPEPSLELPQAPNKIPPRGGFADVTFWNASSPRCGSTGYRISPHLPPSQTMPWIYGSGRRTQLSKQLLWHSHGMDGNARRSCWSLCPAFCPSWSGKVPCVVSTLAALRAVAALQMRHCPSGTLERCAIATSARDRRKIPLQAQQNFLYSKQTNLPTHVVSLLCQVLFCWWTRASNFFLSFVCQPLAVGEEQASSLP